jgi:hypothetical protein
MENRRTHLNYLGEGRLEQARTKYIRAKPYNPGSTMMPLNRRLMGEGRDTIHPRRNAIDLGGPKGFI